MHQAVALAVMIFVVVVVVMSAATSGAGHRFRRDFPSCIDACGQHLPAILPDLCINQAGNRTSVGWRTDAGNAGCQHGLTCWRRRLV